MTKWCGWFKFPDNVTLKAVSPACFLVSSSFLALPLLLWNSWPFPSISELSLSWFPQVSFLASWWWWGWYRVEEEARKPAQMLGPELDWVISQVPEVVKTKEPPESQRSKVKEQCWLQEDGFQGASVLQWLSPAPLTKEGGGGGYDSSWQSCVVIWGGGRIVCAYVGPFFKQGEIG